MHYAEERFMDLIEVNMKQEQKQHVYAWENITLVEEEADLANKLLPSLHFWPTTFACSLIFRSSAAQLKIQNALISLIRTGVNQTIRTIVVPSTAALLTIYSLFPGI
jgi:hypothetical protein